MRELHLFAGCGGGILGGMLLGHTCVCAVEIEPYCRKVLLQRQRDGILPKFPIWDDVRTFQGTSWRGIVDVVHGGFPCQDVSAAGTGAGIDGIRSGLWREMSRVVREVRPRFVLVENSPSLTIRGLGRVVGDLSEMGFDIRHGIFSACSIGFPHSRERMFILAHASRVRLEWGRPKCPTRFDRRPELEGLLERLSSMAVRAGKFWRKHDGVADRLDRGKAIGNGQVPAVVKLAWETLAQ